MAQSTSDQHHDVFWADNDDKKQKTMAYAERARSIAENEMLKKDTNHPWKELPHKVSCNFRIYEIEGDHINLESGPPSFSSPRDLLMYWENTPKDGTAEKRNRRVIILEDVTARIAELLGVLLDIPPEFFLAHCDESVDLNVMNERFITQGSSTYWKMPVPQRRNLPEAFHHEGLADVFCGSFNRGSLPMDKGISWVTFRSLVSYWGKTYGAGSWTTVILVDPQHAHLHLAPASDQGAEARSVDLENWQPSRDILREVINSSEYEHLQVYQRSLFDTLAKAHSKLSMTINDDAFSATFFARNCIRSVWEEHV